MRPAITVMAAVVTLLLNTTPALAYPPPGQVAGDTVVHDPTMIRTPFGYVLYSTHGHLEARTSADGVTFTRAGDAFDTPPAWWSTYSAENDPWAPDISHERGKYLMYYAVSSFGSNHSAIGLATSRTGRPGSWTDRGIVYATELGMDHNAIDPNLLVDREGRWWLSFGSYWTGIRMIRLDPRTGLRHEKDRTLYHLATRPDAPYAVEAPDIVERGGYYYLFASYDRCCAGLDSTYKIKVGRSTSPTGPYTGRDGQPMMTGGGTLLLETHGRFVGPGGQSVMRDRGRDVLVYHYYDGDDGGTPKLGLNRLAWDADGWPHVS
ncbi:MULTISPECIES: arabinan endo-1,5-alpha-L-arabinosidase [Nonomuraea]|uniref:Arabinan endo-1,5-alpha-L-arabinosidase n=1 Tax=Nonomuraea harbinensis TaxID=1286938 RepID=A0ABW1BPX2_9ACTN|nr:MULTISPECIES: arabinan endo-1,5-alpha-L-arabinosidase [Nonomuraea]